jgi:phage terminase large subunit
METLRVQTTKVFRDNWRNWDRYKVLVNQGSSRSSKTFSVAQLFILKLVQQRGKVLTIVRKTTPALKISVMRDFINILIEMDMYEPSAHNKSDNIYQLGDNLVEFISMDNPQKKRGAKRDYLWLNEANELDLEDWRQLAMRTTEKIILDYNPSDEFHWIYDQVITREDACFIKSTYKDNPFLEQSIVDEIERYKELDPNYYRIFGLGERGTSQASVFTNNWEIIEAMPECNEYAYGIDWGYHHPMTVVKVGFRENELYWQELYYEKGKLTDDLIQALPSLSIQQGDYLVPDSAETDRIEQLYQAGYYATYPAKKSGLVTAQLDRVKKYKMYITSDSVNLIKEMRNYKYATNKDGTVLDNKTVKVNDDAIDAARYASIFLINNLGTMVELK